MRVLHHLLTSQYSIVPSRSQSTIQGDSNKTAADLRMPQTVQLTTFILLISIVVSLVHYFLTSEEDNLLRYKKVFNQIDRYLSILSTGLCLALGIISAAVTRKMRVMMTKQMTCLTPRTVWKISGVLVVGINQHSTVNSQHSTQTGPHSDESLSNQFQ